MAKKLRLELVTWEDTFSVDGWVRREEWIKQHTPVIATSTGYVIYEDKKRLIITQTTTVGDDDICGVLAIPKAAIIKRRRIKV